MLDIYIFALTSHLLSLIAAAIFWRSRSYDDRLFDGLWFPLTFIPLFIAWVVTCDRSLDKIATLDHIPLLLATAPLSMGVCIVSAVVVMTLEFFRCLR